MAESDKRPLLQSDDRESTNWWRYALCRAVMVLAFFGILILVAWWTELFVGATADLVVRMLMIGITFLVGVYIIWACMGWRKRKRERRVASFVAVEPSSLSASDASASVPNLSKLQFSEGYVSYY